MAACARSPAFNQEPWVWRQGPGNVADVERRHAAIDERADPREPIPQPHAKVTVGDSTQRPAAAAEQARATQPQAMATKTAATGNAGMAGGNRRYTQAVRYGDQLYVSGQIPIDSKSLKIVGGNIEEQTRAVMNNIQKILQDNGMTMSNIVSTTLYLKEINDLNLVDSIYETYFRRTLPARTVVAVADLPRGSLLEISIVAGQ